MLRVPLSDRETYYILHDKVSKDAINTARERVMDIGQASIWKSFAPGTKFTPNDIQKLGVEASMLPASVRFVHIAVEVTDDEVMKMFGATKHFFFIKLGDKIGAWTYGKLESFKALREFVAKECPNAKILMGVRIVDRS